MTSPDIKDILLPCGLVGLGIVTIGLFGIKYLIDRSMKEVLSNGVDSFLTDVYPRVKIAFTILSGNNPFDDEK
ncbi:MAG: hypothetical protein Q7R95_10030 [bacterium]|nr:hypothetical protein [bacterium]